MRQSRLSCWKPRVVSRLVLEYGVVQGFLLVMMKTLRNNGVQSGQSRAACHLDDEDACVYFMSRYPQADTC